MDYCSSVRGCNIVKKLLVTTGVFIDQDNMMIHSSILLIMHFLWPLLSVPDNSRNDIIYSRDNYEQPPAVVCRFFPVTGEAASRAAAAWIRRALR